MTKKLHWAEGMRHCALGAIEVGTAQVLGITAENNSTVSDELVAGFKFASQALSVLALNSAMVASWNDYTAGSGDAVREKMLETAKDLRNSISDGA